MQKSDAIDKLSAAMVKAQPMVEGAKKDAVNPFFKSKYADLAAVWDAVRDALEKNDLMVSQLPDHAPDGSPALTTMIIHSSGQWISSTYPLAVAKPDAQSFGSAISYARRYSLAALMGVLADDDDGNAATKAPASKPLPAAIQSETMTAASSAPTTTPAEWTNKAIERVKGFKTSKELGEFEEKYHAKIAKIRPVEPELHAKLVDTIRNQYVVFAS